MREERCTGQCGETNIEACRVAGRMLRRRKWLADHLSASGVVTFDVARVAQAPIVHPISVSARAKNSQKVNKFLGRLDDVRGLCTGAATTGRPAMHVMWRLLEEMSSPAAEEWRQPKVVVRKGKQSLDKRRLRARLGWPARSASRKSWRARQGAAQTKCRLEPHGIIDPQAARWRGRAQRTSRQERDAAPSYSG